MAGFMAGFAGALTDGINERKKRKAEREDDVFKMSYTAYLNNKQEMKAAREKDRAAAANAEMLAAGTDNPEESYKVIYQSLLNGADPDYLKDALRENRIKLIDTPTVDKPATEKTPEVAKPNMEAQMGEVVPVAKESVAPQQETNWFADMFSNESSNPEQYRDSAIKKIADATGEDVSKVSEIITGNFDSPRTNFTKFVFEKKTQEEELKDLDQEIYSMNEADRRGDTMRRDYYARRVAAISTANALKAKNTARANNTDVIMMSSIGPDGQYLGSLPISKSDLETAKEGGTSVVKSLNGKEVDINQLQMLPEDFQTDYMKLFKDYNQNSEDYNNAMLAFTSSASIANKIIRIGNQNKEVLGSPAIVAGYFRDAVNNIESAVTLLDKQFNSKPNGNFTDGEKSNMVSSINRVVQEDASRLSDILSDETRAAGERRAALESLQTLLAYQLAAMDLQTGRSLTNEELANYKKMVTNTGPESLEGRLNEILGEKYAALGNRARRLTGESSEVSAFEKVYGVKTGLMPMTPEEVLAGAPENQDAIERLEIIKQSVNAPYVPASSIAPEQQEDNTQNLNPTPPDLMQRAREAIASGKDPEAVRQRLIENGFDPGDL